MVLLILAQSADAHAGLAANRLAGAERVSLLATASANTTGSNKIPDC